MSAPKRSTAPRSGGGGEVPVLLALGFVGAHVLLAALMRGHPAVATAHALATVVLGVAWATSGRRPERVACVAAYIAGSEVLWRMTGADFFWEGGKYATVLVLVVALVWARRLRPPVAMLAYFGLLLPSTVILWAEVGASQARSQTSFNLSGPLSLAVCVWFFSRLRISRSDFSRILLALLAPVAGIFTASFLGTVTAADLSFGSGSNMVTSGGFGPNQVSALLGLGALAAFVLAIDRRLPIVSRAGFFGAMLAFAAQSALTFSRTGLVAMVLCVGVGAVFLARSHAARFRVAVVLVLLTSVAALVLLPRLESLTQGAVVDRFLDTSPTGRDQLAMADLVIFREHPLLGVGPGQAKPLRIVEGRIGVAHTEFTRMLAEHGVLGLVALLFLLSTAVRRFRATQGPEERAIVAMLYAWSLAFMLVSGMRVVAPSFAFGLATALPALAPRTRHAPAVGPAARFGATLPLPQPEPSPAP
jgi:O-antigen ligase